MKTLRRYALRGLAVAAALVPLLAAPVFAPGAAALDYPKRTVKVVVPFPAGGSADLMPRVVFDYLSRKWGQPVVIENKPGAGGNIGAETVFNAEPDGYTLLASPPPPYVMNLNLYRKIGYDPAAFVPVSVLSIVPSGLVANPAKVSAKTVSELIAYAGTHPGALTSATQGNGTTSHLTSALFQMMAKVQFIHVPYRGTSPALQGMLAGDCDLMFDNLGVSLPLVRSGQLRLIAVASEKRMVSLPDVPTIAETLPGFASAAWYAVALPPKSSREIAAKLSGDIAEAIRQPEVLKRFADLSAEPVASDPDGMALFMREETARWGNVIKTANVKME